MTLTPGTKLGPYEIVAPLGAGGMGEVYRARDTRLGRDVAIKVLPLHLSANPEVRARFEREAKTVSALNHPNICTLFDVGREGETDYLVMELVEGETLAERLRRGALPLADVLRWGAQVADALDRAHRAGVVHRDLKPGNVMLTKNGAKLMDFGLARASATAGPVSGSGATMAALTQHPTVASPLTAEGAIVGTFQYMAPEQLEGREADARADLWALGCVLYEMATGRRAFEGRSQASLITAIMGSQPAPLASLAPLSPPALERLVNALLAKDADDRIQTAHDVKLQLGWMSEPGSAASAAGAAPVAAVRKAGAPVWLAPALAVVALAAGVLVGAKLLRPHERPVTTQVPLPNGTRMPLFTSVAAISPDGRHVVAAADGDAESASSRLLLLPLERYAPTVLVPATAIMMPCWSPDSRSVAYFDNRVKEVSTLAISGGSPTKLCAFSDPRGLTWGRKGTIVFAPTPTGPLQRVSQAGGAPQPATVLDSTRGEASHRFPCFLPDGEHFLFVALPAGPEGFPIKLGSIHSTESREVMRAESGVTVSPSGKIVYVRRGKVVAQAFDMRAMRPRGEPVAITDASQRSDMDGEPPATASADGRLLLARLPKPLASMEWLDRKGTLLSSVPVGESDWLVHSLSPDQRTALATSEGSLWQVDLERGVPTRLLESVDPVECAVFSPDGRRILATDKSGEREDLVILPFGGGATISTGIKTALFQEPRAWAPDGSLLVAALGGPEGDRATSGSWDFWRLPPGDAAPERYVSSPDFERYASLSPDSRWVAWTRRAEGQFDMLVDSWPTPGQRLQLFAGTTLAWELVYWGLGGRELLYLDAKNRMMSMPLTFGPDGPRAGPPVRLFEMPAGTFSFTTRDGSRFLVSRDAHPGNLPTLLLIQNWEALLLP